MISSRGVPISHLQVGSKMHFYLRNWLYSCRKYRGIGHSLIETPFEKLARLNRHRNIDLTGVKTKDLGNTKFQGSKRPKLQFAEFHTEIYTGTLFILFIDGESEVDLQSNGDRDSISTTASNDRVKEPAKKTSFLDVTPFFI